MRKLKTFVLLGLLFLCLGVIVGCSEQQFALDTPGDLELNENILSWNKIEDATEYQLRFRQGKRTFQTLIAPDSVEDNSERLQIDLTDHVGDGFFNFIVEVGETYDVSIRARRLSNPEEALFDRRFENSAWTNEVKWTACSI